MMRREARAAADRARRRRDDVCGGPRATVVIALEEVMRIYVGNMSYSTTEDSLRAAFAAHGEVEEVAVPADRDSGRA